MMDNNEKKLMKALLEGRINTDDGINSAVMSILSELSKDGKSEALNNLINDVYCEIPVDTKTFFTHPAYCGQVGQDLYPKLFDDIIKIFEGDYTEVILSGASGWGKGYVANMIMCRLLYEVSCLKSPQRFYGLTDESTISFSAITDESGFNLMKKVLDKSPYFRDKFPFIPHTKEIEFPKNIQIEIDYPPNCGIGENVFSAIIDTSQLEKDQIETVCTSIARRMESRFAKNGKLPGLLVTISHANNQSDFIKKKIEKAKDNPKIFIMDYAEWEVKPKGFYGDKKFWVSIGTEDQGPKIIESKVIEVPIDFLSDFKRDLKGSLRDIAGVVINANS